MEAQLKPHPRTPKGSTGGIIVLVEREGEILRLQYVVDVNIDAVRWPEPARPGRADNLWRHTCFEAFVETDDGYVEFNLSPSHEWASYRFDSPRCGMRRADEVATVLGLVGAYDHVALEARIELPLGAKRLGLSAVIEDVDGVISYWALNHPPGKPDFHHPDSFVLDLP